MMASPDYRIFHPISSLKFHLDVLQPTAPEPNSLFNIDSAHLLLVPTCKPFIFSENPGCPSLVAFFCDRMGSSIDPELLPTPPWKSGRFSAAFSV
jgi:hypothetical protein